MPRVRLETRIEAPPERVFDLARSIDLHAHGQARHHERPIAGVISGLIGPGESVTWEARHFGITQKLTSRIVAFDRPRSFRDSMVSGAFARFDHDHIFEPDGSGTRMTDVFDFASPFGLLGRAADWLVLSSYMKRLVRERALSIKHAAESDEWKSLLHAG
jgi:ligand-binding SRPBCC domain-containing protein